MLLVEQSLQAQLTLQLGSTRQATSIQGAANSMAGDAIITESCCADRAIC